jgi:anaerobic magnesium-protoporphyrin IX monomethyl ester cyclase
MRILFINPRYDETQYRFKVNKLCPPLGMAYIASILLREGHSVKILDMEALKMDWAALPSFLVNEAPDLVGIHGTTPTSKYIAQCAKIVKETCPTVTLVIGGTHATLLPEEVLGNIPQADYILRGEAEFTMRDLVDGLENSQKAAIAKIPGICFRRGKRIFVSPQSPRIEDLDSLPLPAYDLLPIDAYFETGEEGRVFTMMSSRGCPYDCIYCCDPILYGHIYRARSPQNVVNEMSVLANDYKVNHIVFYDAEFMIDANRVEQICSEIISRSLHMTWRVRARADRVTEPLLRLMKKAGCTEISIGVETGSQRLLDVLNKRCNIEDIEKAFQIAKKVGVWTVGYFMFGFPGETPQDSYRTVEFAKQLDPDWALFSVATPLPGTKFYEMVKDNIITTDWSRFKQNANSPVVSYDEMKEKDLSEIIEYAYRSFYLREEWLVNRLRKVSSKTKMERVVKSFFYYLNKTLLPELPSSIEPFSK